MYRLTVSALLSLVLLLSGRVFAEDAAVQPGYYEMSPSLIANLAGGGKYIRCDIQFMSLDPEMVANIEKHAPTLRHELLMLMSEQDGAKLQTAEGKEGLRQAAMELSRKVLRELTGKSSVDELFFTAFFVQ